MLHDYVTTVPLVELVVFGLVCVYFVYSIVRTSLK